MNDGKFGIFGSAVAAAYLQDVIAIGQAVGFNHLLFCTGVKITGLDRLTQQVIERPGVFFGQSLCKFHTDGFICRIGIYCKLLQPPHPVRWL